MHRHWIQSRTNFTHIPLVFRCHPVDMGVLIGHTVEDAVQRFRPYLGSAWAFVLREPGVSKLKDQAVLFAGRPWVEQEDGR